MTTLQPAMPEACLSDLPFTRLHLTPRGWLFHAGQPGPGLYFVHAGYLRTSVGSDDGRERITAFPMRGDWLGLDSLGSACHASDAVSLDTSEVWHLPVAALAHEAVANAVAAYCARQLREQQAWALAVGSLCAEHRVLAFLEDQARRHAGLGCSATRFTLRMTRAEIGNFLALQIETVTRALAKLQASGRIQIERRDVTLLDVAHACHDTAPPPLPAVRGHRAWGAFRSRARGGLPTHAHGLT